MHCNKSTISSSIVWLYTTQGSSLPADSNSGAHGPHVHAHVALMSFVDLSRLGP